MRKVLVISLVLLLIGCKATKETSSMTENKLNRESISQLRGSELSNQFIADSILIGCQASIKKIERVYALPDSTGKQAILSETEYQIELDGQKQVVSLFGNNSQSNLQGEKVITEQQHTVETKDEETESRFFQPPDWLFFLFFMVFIIGIFLKYRPS